MLNLRRGAAFALTILFLAGTAICGWAEEPAGMPVAAAEMGAAEEETVSSWPELRDWLAAHKRSGGTVRLTADIEIGEDYDYTADVPPRDFREPVTVECGAHTISVLPGAEVYLSMTMYKLTVSGTGGERGLLRVLPGGALYLGMLNLTAASAADSAVVQEEGALLVVDQKDYPPVLTGQIRYAAAPVLLAPEGVGPSFCVVPESAAEREDIAAALPETAMLRINWQGKMQRSVEQPVVWDTAAIADDLAVRRRTMVRGSYIGALNGAGAELNGLLAQDCPQFSAPQRTLAFPVDGAALLAVSFLVKNDALIGVSLDFVAEGPMKSQTLISQDEGVSWMPLGEQKDQPLQEDGSYYTGMIWPDEPLAGTPWFLVELIYPDGTIRHTDVIAYAAGMEYPIDYVDGHRGGGEPVAPPEPPASSAPPEDPGAQEPAPPLTEVPSSDGSSSVTQIPGSVQPSPPVPDKKGSASGGAGQASVSSSAAEEPDEEKIPASASEDSAVKAMAPVPSEPDTPGPKAEEAPSQGLSPGMQVAIGVAAVALIGVAAVAILNPHLLRRLRRRGRRK